MLSWWTNMESVAALNNWILTATLIFAALTGVLVFLTVGKSSNLISRLFADLESSRKRIRTLEKTAGGIRKELLQTQQHQDISQLKLKTSKSSAQELRQALLDARKRLETAEAAVKAHQEQASEDEFETINVLDLELEPEVKAAVKAYQGHTFEDESETIDVLDLELEPEVGLSESQRDQLVDLLDPGPKGNVDIFCIMGDDLSESTARQLEDILSSDGWKTNGVAQSAFSNPPKGLVLVVNSKETAPSYASFLQRVFSTIGMEVSAKFDNKYREWSLTVLVGTLDS